MTRRMMNQLTGTISESIGDLTVFVLIFMIVMLGFTQVLPSPILYSINVFLTECVSLRESRTVMVCAHFLDGDLSRAGI